MEYSTVSSQFCKTSSTVLGSTRAGLTGLGQYTSPLTTTGAALEHPTVKSKDAISNAFLNFI